MQRLGVSAAAALAVVQLVGCAARQQSFGHTTKFADDRRIEAADREIEAYDRKLRRQRAEIEDLRSRAEREEPHGRAAIEGDDDRIDAELHDDR